jgi:ribosomal protein S18 acetylase RimI-like enzyme
MTAAIRPAREDDIPGIARVHVDTWRSAYAGIVPDEALASLSYAERESRWRNYLINHPDTNYVYVAEDDGEIVGFVSGGPLRDDTSGYTSELYAIYVLEHTQGTGVGRRLVQALVRDLLEREHESMLLWVFRDNPPARGFYEKLGGQYVSEKTFEFGGKELVEVSYGWKDIRPLLDTKT